MELAELALMLSPVLKTSCLSVLLDADHSWKLVLRSAVQANDGMFIEDEDWFWMELGFFESKLSEAIRP